MTNFKNLFAIVALMLVPLIGAQAQTALTQTTLSAAVTSTTDTFTVVSATGISANINLYIIDKGHVLGELVTVRSVSGTTLKVNRGGGFQRDHVTGSLVVIAPVASAFKSHNPYGSCTGSATGYAPWINTTTGEQWLCSSVTGGWVPGFGNSNPKSPTVAVASAAGTITPSGPLFHVTGTAAITGFVIPIGYTGGGFCIIPDGAFTTTNATNIAIASTGVVSQLLCYGYDPAATKPFFPTY